MSEINDCSYNCLIHLYNEFTYTTSFSASGVKFYCRNCGREGHRRHYCPELKDSLTDRQFRCRICGEKGHNRRTCPKTRLTSHKNTVRKHFLCRICHQRGHNRRTCPEVIDAKSSSSYVKKGSLISGTRKYECRLCQQVGHNIRTCPSRNVNDSQFEEGNRWTYCALLRNGLKKFFFFFLLH